MTTRKATAMSTPKQINQALRAQGEEIQKIRTRVTKRIKKLEQLHEERADRFIKFLKKNRPRNYFLTGGHEGAVDALIDAFARSVTRGTQPGAITLTVNKPTGKGERTFVLEPYGVFRINNPNADNSVEILAKNSGGNNGWIYVRYNYNERAPGGVVENASNGLIVVEEDLPRIKHLLKGRKENTLSLAMLTVRK
ncbi:MAG: hypothetical protein RLZZ347_276 [Candidatus Parcubacteria bacterium]